MLYELMEYKIIVSRICKLVNIDEFGFLISIFLLLICTFIFNYNSDFFNKVFWMI